MITLTYGDIIRVGHDHAIYHAKYIGPTRQVAAGQAIRVQVHGHICEDLPYRPRQACTC